MAFVPRYTMNFNDQEGAAWIVNFLLDGYAGQADTMIAGQRPLVIRYDGDEDNIFDTIRTSKATIQTYVEDGGSAKYQDTDSINDKEFLVTAECPQTGYKFIGWLTPDQRHDKFPLGGYYLSFTAVDFFSYAKSALMTDLEGRVIQNKQPIIDLLKACILRAIHDPAALEYDITSVINYDTADTSLTNPLSDCLQSPAVYAENFLDINGRPLKGQSVFDSILEAFGMHVFISNGVFHFRCPLALVPDSIRTNHISEDVQEVVYPNDLVKVIGTKGFGSSFLLENSEDKTTDRPSKEVSVRFNYNSVISIIPNSQFYEYGGTVGDDGRGDIPGWTRSLLPISPGVINDGDGGVNDILRLGTGRAERPFLVQIIGRSNKGYDGGSQGPGPDAPGFSAGKFYSTSFRGVNAGDILNISIKYQYEDYLRISGFPSNRSPRLIFQIFLYDGTQYRNYLSHYDGASKGVINTAIEEENHWISILTAAERTIIPSSKGISTYSITTTPAPFSGDIIISLLPIEFDFPNFWGLPQYINYLSVQVGIQADVSGQQYTGEIHYQTQSQDYSQIEDTEEVEIGDGPNTSVSGSLYKGADSDTLTKYWKCLIDNSVYPLLQQLVRMKMFFARNPKKKIQVDLYSNTLFFEHMIVFRNGDQPIVQGKYMQLTDEYDVKACRHTIVCVDLAGNYKDGTGGDAYEYYQQTTGG